jgi:hypothetical protein
MERAEYRYELSLMHELGRCRASTAQMPLLSGVQNMASSGNQEVQRLTYLAYIEGSASRPSRTAEKKKNKHSEIQRLNVGTH